MKSDAESKINQNDEYRPLELVDENVDQTGLEDVCVEEEQEQDDDRKQNTDILNSVKKTLHYKCLMFLGMTFRSTYWLQ